MNNEQSSIDDYVNTANGNISTLTSKFLICLEDITVITEKKKECDILENEIAVIEQSLDTILKIYRKNIREYVKKNIYRISAANSQLGGNDVINN